MIQVMQCCSERDGFLGFVLALVLHLVLSSLHVLHAILAAPSH